MLTKLMSITFAVATLGMAAAFALNAGEDDLFLVDGAPSVASEAR